MASRTINIDNNGEGGTPFLTFAVDNSGGRDFSQSDLDDNLTSCVVSANNEVGMGSAGDKLFGKVVWVSQESQADTIIPALCAVQARGVARFRYTGKLFVNQMVEVDGTGQVRQASGVYGSAGGHLMRGQVIAVYSVNGTCDVWLS